MKFKSRENKYSEDKAQVYGTELYEIMRLHNKLTPADVVYHARNPKNVLHDVFEWDDDKAAYEHRLNQARTLIRDIVEVVVVSDHKDKRDVVVNSFHHVKVEGEKYYVHVSEAVTNNEYSKQILDDLISRIDKIGDLMKAFKAYRSSNVEDVTVLTS